MGVFFLLQGAGFHVVCANSLRRDDDLFRGGVGMDIAVLEFHNLPQIGGFAMAGKKKNDVVVVSFARTATGNYGGSLKNYLGIDLAAIAIKEALNRANYGNGNFTVDDVILGQCYYRAKEEPNIGRLAPLKAGLPLEVTGMTLQRACASGLQAIITGSQELQTGWRDVVIAGGAESMSNAPYELYQLRWGSKIKNAELVDTMYGTILSCPPTGTGMGITAENLCDRFNISREECDNFSMTSHLRAQKATENGLFKEEIVPITIKERGKETVFAVDECIRADTSMEKLGKLKPVFKEGGKITAGNSCPMNDGASVLVMMTRETAEKHNLQPLASIVDFAVVGIDPDIMGYGPVPATRKALERAGLKLSDIDLFEVNEAFAPVGVVFLKELGVSHEKVNVNGGAIAMGHAVGSTGGRLSCTLINEMRRRGVKYGIATICQGTGMGTALIYRNEAM